MCGWQMKKKFRLSQDLFSLFDFVYTLQYNIQFLCCAGMLCSTYYMYVSKYKPLILVHTFL